LVFPGAQNPFRRKYGPFLNEWNNSAEGERQKTLKRRKFSGIIVRWQPDLTIPRLG
jgi:hypothetical protein